MNSQYKAQNPMSEYLLKIQLIINHTEFKNKAEADKYETMKSKTAGGAYVRAVLKTDIFESYQYDGRVVHSLLSANGISDDKIFYYINNPQMMPQKFKDVLLQQARDILIESYNEQNKYYMTLTGKPFQGNSTTAADKVLTIPDDFYNLYQLDGVLQRNEPVHEMPAKYQELFMNSEYYAKMVEENPDSRYLQYIGTNAIPIYVSRPTRDGDIMRIQTNKLSTYNDIFGNITVSPNIIHKFTNVYQETRNYVYDTLRGDFSSIYPNYDSFIRFLTIYLSIGNSLNEFMKQSTSMAYMNNVTANNFFMLYGLPSVIMEGSSMINFLKKFRLILADKGTNVVYRVKDLIGYEYTDIYTLVMVKQQVFENGIPVYQIDDNGIKTPKQEIFFRRLGTTDDNTSYFKFRDSDTSYTVDEITSGDPRWWNTPEVEQMLQEMNYTLSNSKYIQLSTHLSMTDIWWQCVILLRGLLDRKQETQFTLLNLNFNINGVSEISIFDAVLMLVILMDWHLKDVNGNIMAGNIYLPNGTYDGKAVCLDLLFNGLNSDGSPKELILGLPYKISSFNFKIREEKREFYNSIKLMSYINPDEFLPMLDVILDREYNNIGEVLMTDVRTIYKYLENKLRDSRTISEFRQVTDVFSNLFLVDPIREWYDRFDIDQIIIDEYGISLNDLAALKSFFTEDPESPDLTVTYDNKNYPIILFNVLNTNVTNLNILDEYPFRDPKFVIVFNDAMKKYSSNSLMSTSISPVIKSNYQNIIIDKVQLDIGNTDDGPKTFESLLFRSNPRLYRYMQSIKSNGDTLILLMRSIIKALEKYVNTSLSGLECSVIGIDEYFRILKEVITYFKSYMVEFTKDEFVYIFDGLFDNGGNSNMLKLYDTISSAEMDILPKDSLTLYDVSSADMHIKIADNNVGLLHDEAIFRMQATYQTILNLKGYEILYDNGETISHTPPGIIDPSTKIIAQIISNEDTSSFDKAYKIIINTYNLDVIPPNYYGNTLK